MVAVAVLLLPIPLVLRVSPASMAGSPAGGDLVGISDLLQGLNSVLTGIHVAIVILSATPCFLPVFCCPLPSLFQFQLHSPVAL